jgi:hypothetical protein
VGYPDWQSYGNWRGAAYVDTTVNYSSGNPYVLDTIVTNWNAIRIFIEDPSIGCEVLINFYVDSTASQLLQQLTYTLGPGTILDATIPITGNFLNFEITTTQASAGSTPLVIAPSNMPVPRPIFNDNNAMAGGVFVNVNAGQTIDIPIPVAVQGTGYINFTTSAATGVFTIALVTIGQNNVAEFAILSLKSILSLNGPNFFVPAAGLQLQITNNDTVAHTVNYWLQVLSQ